MGHIIGSLRSVEMSSTHSVFWQLLNYSLTFNGTVRSPDAMSLSSWCLSPLRNSTNQPSQRSTTFFSLVQTCRDVENEKFYVRNCRDWVFFLYISIFFVLLREATLTFSLSNLSHCPVVIQKEMLLSMSNADDIRVTCSMNGFLMLFCADCI